MSNRPRTPRASEPTRSRSNSQATVRPNAVSGHQPGAAFPLLWRLRTPTPSRLRRTRSAICAPSEWSRICHADVSPPLGKPLGKYQFGVSSVANHGRTGVIAVLAFVLALYGRDGYAAVDAQQVKALLVKIGYPAGGITIVGVLTWALRHREPGKRIHNFIRRAIGATDRLLFRRSS
jgi:hypothetical protein